MPRAQVAAFQRGWPVTCDRIQEGYYVLVDPVTMSVQADECLRQSCLACVRHAALDRAWALTRARPDWGIVVTDAGASFPEVQAVLADLQRRARRLGYPWTWAWTAEPNPGREGSHVHGWLRGPDPGDVLAQLQPKLGCGLVLYEPVRQTDGPMTYPMKMLRALVGMSLVDAQATFDDYHRLNGQQQIIHATRGFWLDRSGVPTGIKAAIRSASAGHPGSRPQRVPIDQLGDYLSARGHGPSPGLRTFGSTTGTQTHASV